MRKDFKLLALAIVVAVVGFFTATIAADTYICGDANGSGGDPAVDIDDVVYLITYVFSGGPAPVPLWVGDVDYSGGDIPIDIDDVVYLINYVFSGGPQPVCLQYTTPGTTTIIPQEDTTSIQDYDTLTGAITLDESSVYAQDIEVGDIAIGQDDVAAPYGFLRKVTSKTTQGNSVVLETEPSTMMEAFEAMNIVETHQLRPSDVVSYRLHQGTRYVSNKDDETFTVELAVVLYDQDGDPGTTDDQIRLDGDYAFTAALFAEIDISWFTLQKFETGIETEQDVSLGIIGGIEWACPVALTFELAKFHLGAIPVGGVVWLVPTLTVKASIHGDLSVTFETGIEYTQQLRCGFGWTNDEYYTFNENAQNFAYTPPQFNREFDFEPGVSLSVSCLLYGVAGPYVGGKGGFHFQSALGADPCNVELSFALDANLYASVGIACNIIGGFGLSYSYDWQLYTQPVGEWSYPLGGSGTITVDPEPDVLNAPWVLAGPCEYSSSGAGDETLTSLDPGDYTITWGAVAGWITPASEMQTLLAGETVTLNGVYVDDSDSTGTVTDYDGNVYQTIRIGDQWWMAQNLKVTHYRNGDPIPNVTDGSTWGGLTTGAYCNYANDEGNVAVYGRLYNWYAVDDSRNIAPAGWHMPSDDEWKQLEMCLGMSQADADDIIWRGTDEGGKLKEAGTTHWDYPNEGATNESGFSALPGGHRNTDGTFVQMGDYAMFWSSTEFSSYVAWYRLLHNGSSQILRYYAEEQVGSSVRCVRD